MIDVAFVKKFLIKHGFIDPPTAEEAAKESIEAIKKEIQSSDEEKESQAQKIDDIAEKIKKWFLDKKAYIGCCPLCNTNDWIASSITHQLADIYGAIIRNHYSFVRIKCRNCHYIVFMDNSEIGV